MKKIAIINQRYGMEVNGGSEYYTRLIAEKLSKHYDVEILTTTALNYVSWEKHYEEGVCDVNGVKVRRFKVDRPRGKRFSYVHRLREGLGRFGAFLDKIWVREQGPYTPQLVKYINEHADEYDKFIFVTYLYYTTVCGIQKVLDKAILIPTAHDEPFIYFPIYRKIFQNASAMVYLTEEEKVFVEKTFQNAEIPNTVAAVGIDISDELQDEKTREEKILRFREKHGIEGEYIIYAGRIDVGKGCGEMLAFYEKYVKMYSSNIKLVMIGKSVLTIPDNCDIHYLGFVSDEDKMLAIAGAKYLWLPSRFESLSIALLEGLAQGVPGIVNGNCEVLKGHAIRSGAAFAYQTWEEFESCMKQMENMTDDEYAEMSQKAKKYVDEYYCWEVIENKLKDIIER